MDGGDPKWDRQIFPQEQWQQPNIHQIGDQENHISAVFLQWLPAFLIMLEIIKEHLVLQC